VPPRSFDVSEETWLARVGGMSLTGRRSDQGAPLLHVTFHRSTDPDVPVKETVLVGTSLDALDDEELILHMKRSRPYKEPEIKSRPSRRDRGRGQRG
jgi:hypothetical protein